MNTPPDSSALRWLAAGLLALCALAAAAQPAAPARPPDPMDPQARVPALAYRSPLPAAKSAADDPPIAWQSANETVARIGGWRVYAREAAPAAPTGVSPATQGTTAAPAARPAAPAAPAASAPAGHAGHKMP